MTIRNIVLFCAAILAVSGCATKNLPALSDRQAALANARAVKWQWDNAADINHDRDLSPLYAQQKILKDNLAPGTDDPLRIPTLFYLGEIEHIIAQSEAKSGKGLNHDAAQEGLNDLDLVVARNENIPEWGVAISEADYAAGSIANAMPGQDELAMRYWNACAGLGHPGCINNVAGALMDKQAPTDEDIRRALDLHASVVATGIQYSCAGLFSALTSAQLLHFTGVRNPGDDEIRSLEKAQMLYQELRQSSHAADPCSGGIVGVEQYMMLLDRGEHHEALLDEVQRVSSSEFFRQIASYLQHKISDDQWAGLIASKSPRGACTFHFYAAWQAVQSGKKQSAWAHYQAMLNLPDADCHLPTFLMRRYLKM